MTTADTSGAKGLNEHGRGHDSLGEAHLASAIGSRTEVSLIAQMNVHSADRGTACGRRNAAGSGTVAAVESVGTAESSGGVPRQGILLAAAMFVFVIDTSFMNVSISAVVQDLDTTVSGVQSAVAIEALVSAAFILISSKVGDLFGRKRACVVGMVFYAVGALAMVFAQGLAAVIVHDTAHRHQGAPGPGMTHL
ncbi:MAG TPA: MFS transporter, partial [Actinomycetes bacterium]|nr:MFS transporter [Actinomycetes bacterium]